MFSLPQLEAFVAVAEELHFGAAAERLNMTQPPLSRQIQMLEKKLGAQLFGRTSRKVELTAAGATLLPRARQILDMCIKTDLDVRRVSSGKAGTITVGYTAIAGHSALPLMLRRAAENMPRVSFVLRELVSTDQMDGLVKGNVDIGLLRPIVARPGVVSRPLMQDRLVVALPEGGSLLGNMAGRNGEPLPLGYLDRLPLLMYSTKEARYFHGPGPAAVRQRRSARQHHPVRQPGSGTFGLRPGGPGGNARSGLGHGVRPRRRGVPRDRRPERHAGAQPGGAGARVERADRQPSCLAAS